MTRSKCKDELLPAGGGDGWAAAAKNFTHRVIVTFLTSERTFHFDQTWILPIHVRTLRPGATVYTKCVTHTHLNKHIHTLAHHAHAHTHTEAGYCNSSIFGRTHWMMIKPEENILQHSTHPSTLLSCFSWSSLFIKDVKKICHLWRWSICSVYIIIIKTTYIVFAKIYLYILCVEYMQI